MNLKESLEVFINTAHDSESYELVSKQTIELLVKHIASENIGPIEGLKVLVEEVLMPYNEDSRSEISVGGSHKLSSLVSIYHNLDDISDSTEWRLVSIDPPIEEGYIEDIPLDKFMEKFRQDIILAANEWLFKQQYS
ncbi:hypothetical protein ISG33_14515 [Glaciecola sp. MH2013]|uniref:hypothetical protein n=1 Tax=Glaciecola sp. MH2013 TaxID=2785524 RepID=UPI0018A0FC6A|nr:hypothetical protein [Glaciecola sp. MH2013]MBF7074616.1 hypothetical protein [Glaciecola sp. MH2013]